MVTPSYFGRKKSKPKNISQNELHHVSQFVSQNEPKNETKNETKNVSKNISKNVKVQKSSIDLESATIMDPSHASMERVENIDQLNVNMNTMMRDMDFIQENNGFSNQSSLKGTPTQGKSQGVNMKSFLDSLSSPRIMDAPFRRKSVQVNVNVALPRLDFQKLNPVKKSQPPTHTVNEKQKSNHRKGGGYHSARYRRESVNKENNHAIDVELNQSMYKHNNARLNDEAGSYLETKSWKSSKPNANEDQSTYVPAPPSSQPKHTSQRRFTVNLDFQNLPQQDDWIYESNPQSPTSQLDRITLENDAYRSYISGENSDLFQNEVLSSLNEDDSERAKSISSLSTYYDHNTFLRSASGEGCRPISEALIEFECWKDIDGQVKRNVNTQTANFTSDLIQREDVDSKLKTLSQSFQEKLKIQYESMYEQMMQQKEKHKIETNTLKEEYTQKIDEVMKRYFAFKAEKRKYEKFQNEKHKMQQKMQSLKYNFEHAKTELEDNRIKIHQFEKTIERMQVENEKLQEKLKAITEERDQALDELEKKHFDAELLSELQKELETARDKIMRMKEDAKIAENNAREQRELYEKEKRRNDELFDHSSSLSLVPPPTEVVEDIMTQIHDMSWIEGGSLNGNLQGMFGKSVFDEISGTFSAFKSSKDDDYMYTDDFTNHVSKHLAKENSEKLKIVIKDDSLPLSARRQKKEQKTKGFARNYFEDRLQTMRHHIEMQSQSLISVMQKIRKEAEEGSFALSEQKEFLISLEEDLLMNKTNLNSALIIISDSLKMVKLSL